MNQSKLKQNLQFFRTFFRDFGLLGGRVGHGTRSSTMTIGSISSTQFWAQLSSSWTQTVVVGGRGPAIHSVVSGTSTPPTGRSWHSRWSGWPLKPARLAVFCKCHLVYFFCIFLSVIVIYLLNCRFYVAIHGLQLPQDAALNMINRYIDPYHASIVIVQCHFVVEFTMRSSVRAVPWTAM